MRNSSCQRSMVLSQNAWKSPSWQNLLSRLTLLVPLLLHPPCPNLAATLPGRQRRRKIGSNLSHAGEWVCSYLQKNKRVPEWWREFQSSLCSKDEHFSDVQVKGIASQQATAFKLPATQQENVNSWIAPPSPGVLG